MIGVDVGETRVRVELFDLTLTELARAERPLEQRDQVDVIVDHIHAGITEVLAAAGLAPERLLGVGIGVPGIVEHIDWGAVVHGQTIGWDAIELESPAAQRARPCPGRTQVLVNGARTLGQAEMWFGVGRGARNALVVVLFGFGVGDCIVTPAAENGRAVERGYLTVRVRGRRCRSGALGCLEAYAGGESLLARWREEGGRVPRGADEETALSAMLAEPSHPKAPPPAR
ncbi:ROK family protein [Streptomyces hirsutus]